MEYHPTDLRNVLDNVKDDEFTTDDAIIITYNMLCALNFLHSANVWHRDIKPGNILITADCNVLICDFGFARTAPNLSNKEKGGDVLSDSNGSDDTNCSANDFNSS